MDEDIILKIREKESYDIIKYIAIGYFAFLFIYSIILGIEEAILQAMFIAAFALIMESINYGELTVTKLGIKTRKTGYLKYGDIQKIEINKRAMFVYKRNIQKPYKIRFSIKEDYKMIEKAYYFIDSKVKGLEDTHEYEEHINKYLNYRAKKDRKNM